MILDNNPESFLMYKDNFITNEEVEYFINLGETKSNFEQAGVRQPDGTYKMFEEYRNNLRGSFDSKELSVQMLERSLSLLPPKIRHYQLDYFHNVWKFYKYKTGHYFNWHKDGSIVEGQSKSLVTFMIYLTESGSTLFDHDIEIKGKSGRLVIFNHKVKHCSPKLESPNDKIVLRTDVMYIPFYEKIS